MAKRQALPRCEVCKKASLKSEEAAREHLGRLLRSPRPYTKRGQFAVRPYLCPEGLGWHVGRHTATLMIDFKKGRTVNLKRLKQKEKHGNR